MTAENILQSDVLDILFEGRNKLYGAYELRRTYNRRLKKAIGGMLFLITLGAAGYLFGSNRNTSKDVILKWEDSLHIAAVDLTKKPPEEKLPPKPQKAAPKQLATVKDFVPIITKEAIVTEVPDVTKIDTSVIGVEDKPGESVGQKQIVAADPGDGDGGLPNGKGSSPTSIEPALPTGPVDMGGVDEMPLYPGGMQALVRYMVNNLTSELEPDVKYVLKAQFIINEQGNVSDALILSSDDANLNQQVLKAIRKMKPWKPGRIRGHAVAVRFTMPVTFVGPEE